MNRHILIQGPWANGQVLSTQMQLLNMSFRLHSFCSTNKFFTNANNFIMQSIHSNTAANAFSYLQREQVHPYPKQQEEDPKLRCHYFRLWFHGTMSQSRVYACSLKKKKIAWSINLYFIYHYFILSSLKRNHLTHIQYYYSKVTYKIPRFFINIQMLDQNDTNTVPQITDLKPAFTGIPSNNDTKTKSQFSKCF